MKDTDLIPHASLNSKVGEYELDKILDLYFNNLIFFINRYVGNLTVAEDLAEDSIVELFVHPWKSNMKATIKTYLFTIGRNKALNYVKRESKFNIVSFENQDNVMEENIDFESGLIKDERKVLINKALNKLNRDYRTVIHLVYFEDLTYEEAANVMGKNTKQIKNILYRAKNALKNIIGDEYLDIIEE